METTLIILKPDAVARRLVGEITARLERKGLSLVGTKMARLTDEALNDHYAHLADKPFFPATKEFMQRTPVVFQAWRGVDAVNVVRDIVGLTNGREAAVGSIRGDYSMSVQANLIHASDSVETANTELARFLSASEIFEFEHPLLGYSYGDDEIGS